jgi:hypothetical protein
MPRIVFERLQVSEKKQITAGAIVPIGNNFKMTSFDSAAPDNNGCMSPMTVKHGCRIIVI